MNDGYTIYQILINYPQRRSWEIANRELEYKTKLKWIR